MSIYQIGMYQEISKTKTKACITIQHYNHGNRNITSNNKGEMVKAKRKDLKDSTDCNMHFESAPVLKCKL